MSRLIEIEINGKTYRGELELVLEMIKETYKKDNDDNN